MPAPRRRGGISGYILMARALSRYWQVPVVSVLARLLASRVVYGRSAKDFDQERFATKPLRRWREYVTDLELEALQHAASPLAARDMEEDKVRFAAHCEAHGLPVVPTLAIVHAPAMRETTKEPTRRLTSVAELEAFFAEVGELACFAKPLGGGQGYGLLQFDVRNGALVPTAGIPGATELFARCALSRFAHHGYLLQPLLRVHEGLQPFMPGRGVGTVRVSTFLNRQGDVEMPFAVLRDPGASRDRRAHCRRRGPPVEGDVGAAGASRARLPDVARTRLGRRDYAGRPRTRGSELVFWSKISRTHDEPGLRSRVSCVVLAPRHATAVGWWPTAAVRVLVQPVRSHCSLRVLQVIETGGPGGAETVFARLSSGLRDGGHDVQCIVADGDWLPAELRRRGLPVVVTPRSSRSLDLELLRTLRAEMRRSQAQIVHAHLFEGALYAAIAARLEGIPCVATLHGQVDVRRGGFKGRVKSWLFRRLVHRVVAVSEALRRDLQAGLQLPERVFRVIPNGVPVVDADAADMGVVNRASPDASTVDRPRRVIAIGNIRRPKDYPTLLDAMARVRDAVPSVQLEILGQPDREGLYEALQAQVERLALGETVTFRGFVADPSALLQAADVFVLSSSQEGFSLATIEAMLAGVPVVATRSGGPQEILADGVTGLLVPVRDPDALAAALVRVLRDTPPFAARMSQAARKHARLTYSEAGMVSAYVTLYDELVARAAS